MVLHCLGPHIRILLEIWEKMRIFAAFYLWKSLRYGPMVLWNYGNSEQIFMETNFLNAIFLRSGFLKFPFLMAWR